MFFGLCQKLKTTSGPDIERITDNRFDQHGKTHSVRVSFSLGVSSCLGVILH